MIRLYNTLTRKKEEFQTLEPNVVKMYVCGVTVYNDAHVGHAMSALVFDIIRRYLEYRGYTFRHVMNYTDVDDKIINRAKQLGEDPLKLSQRYVEDYANDLKNQGKLDLNKPFEVVIEAEFDENGKLKNPRFVRKVGDENLVDLFSRMVAALNDSGFLTYLKPISKDNPGSTIKITVKQGESEVLASVESEASSPERAASLAKALNSLLYFGAGSRAGKDEEVIMKNTNATPDGKKVVVNFSMPRQSVVDMIKKQLEPGA